MRRQLRLLCTALALVSGCASATAPTNALTADPSLDFDSARAHWLASPHANYTFEFDTQGSWFPSPGYLRGVVSGGRLVELNLMSSAEMVDPQSGLTIDELWE